MEFLAAIENTALSIWIREALWSFPTLLVLHAIGMAFLVGISLVFNLSILGFSKTLKLAKLKQFYWVVYPAFIINFVSGLLLLFSYPAKGLTNPVFYFKLAVVSLAFAITVKQRLLFNDNPSITSTAKFVAAATLALWVIGIFSGRFLAYTHTWLLIG